MKGDAIISYFERNPAAAVTIHQLATLTGRSYGWTYHHARALSAVGVLATQRVGAAVVCRLHCRNELSIGALCWASGSRADAFYKAQPAVARTIAAIVHTLPTAVAIVVVEDRITVIAREQHGRQVVDGHELELVRPGKDVLAALAQGTIVYGYERFWRLWGEYHG
jgi:hypothetical protein